MLTNDTQDKDNAITEHENNIECTDMGEKHKEMMFLVSEGHHTDPPEKWFREMCLKIDRDHPNITIHQRKTMVLGMWGDLTKSAKIEVIKEYKRGCLN